MSRRTRSGLCRQSARCNVRRGRGGYSSSAWHDGDREEVAYRPMELSALAQQVARLSLGKRLPDGVYVHVDTLPQLPAELRAAVEAAARIAGLDAAMYHVL